MKKDKGITLIALVVTIIILLILAGVTIGVATNGTGLFEKAKLATNEYNNSVEKEEIELNNLEYQIDMNSRDTVTIPKDDYEKMLSAFESLGDNDTEWKSLTSGVKYIKRNGYVTVKANMGTSINIPANCTTANNVSLGTLPEGYRPNTDMYFPITYGANNGDAGCCVVATDGTMKLIGRNAGTYVIGTFTFPIL